MPVLYFYEGKTKKSYMATEFVQDFMEVDCDEIDKLFLPPKAFNKALLTPISGIAPPQSNPFLSETTSMEKILKKMSPMYR